MNSPATTARDKIIVALDLRTKKAALDLVSQLSGQISFFKIGLQLYTAEGPKVVRDVLHTGAKVFLDLKLHDIPNTVAGAVRSAAALGVQMLTIHLSGGEAMIRAALHARSNQLSIFGVTVLTSADDETLRQVGVESSVPDQVLRLAGIGAKAGIDGLIASSHELPTLRGQFGDNLKIAVPGIRPSWSEVGDQKRVMTPREALKAGADFLVIGRPITAHPNPREAVADILTELG